MPAAAAAAAATRAPRRALAAALLLSLAAAASAACKGSQSYIVSIQTSFTRSKSPIVPEKASIPVLVAVAHKRRDPPVLFRLGQRVTDPVAEVIRTGRTDDLRRELDRQLRSSDDIASYSFFDDPGVSDLHKLELTVRDDASFISIIAPLSPSPSWFTGLADYQLCRNDSFVLNDGNIPLKNLNSGLDKGESFKADPEPLPKGSTEVVGPATSIDDDMQFVSLSLEQGSFGVDWWKIFLGVLVGVAVLVVLVFFVLPRLRKKKPTELPLTAQDGVEW